MIIKSAVPSTVVVAPPFEARHHATTLFPSRLPSQSALVLALNIVITTKHCRLDVETQDDAGYQGR